MTSLIAAAGVLISRGPAAAVANIPVGSLFVADPGLQQVLYLPQGGGRTTVGTGLGSPSGVAVNSAGDVFIADNGTNPNRVWKLPAGSGPQTTVTTDLNFPTAVAVDAAGNVFIADTFNNRVVRVAASSGLQTEVRTGLSGPQGVAVDAAGNVFIADTGNDRVLKLPVGGGAETEVGTGMNSPAGIAVDTAGNVFIVDHGNKRVVKVPADGGAQTEVGTSLAGPYGVALDAGGNVFITDFDGSTGLPVGRVVRVPAGGGPQTTVVDSLVIPSAIAVYAPAPTFKADTPPAAATLRTPYRYTYTATTPAGEPAARFAVFSGSLPPGLSLDPATGVLSGTPTTAGVYHFRIQTQNAANATLGPPTTITVGKAAQVIRFTSKPPAHAAVGGSYQVIATGGRSGNPVTFRVDPSSAAGACTVSAAGRVRFSGPGSCVINANQAGNASYAPAAPVSQRIAISAAAPPVANSPELPATGPRPFPPLIVATALLLLGLVTTRAASRR